MDGIISLHLGLGGMICFLRSKEKERVAEAGGDEACLAIFDFARDSDSGRKDIDGRGRWVGLRF